MPQGRVLEHDGGRWYPQFCWWFYWLTILALAPFLRSDEKMGRFQKDAAIHTLQLQNIVEAKGTVP
jgi:hypothetical protein